VTDDRADDQEVPGMKVLVTGGAGYVGGVSVDAIQAAGHQVVVLDDLSTGHRAIPHPDAVFVADTYADTAATRALLDAHGIDAILHCAARSLVSESLRDPARYYRENVAGGIALLEAARAAGVGRFVLSSTAAVYGLPDTTPITEEAPLRPINPYGETKRTLEGALRWYGHAYGVRSVILRYFNVAGASDRLGEVHRPETHLIPNMLAAASGGPPLTIFGDDYPTPDATAVRDYIHVEDLADAHLAALEATGHDDPRTGPAGGSEASTPLVANLGTSSGFSIREVLAAAEAVVGHPIPHAVGPRRAGDPPVLVASNARAGERLGWVPRRSTLDAMIGSAWSWRQAHPDGYGD
jgi:UDP-glucose 4-epimerase